LVKGSRHITTDRDATAIVTPPPSRDTARAMSQENMEHRAYVAKQDRERSRPFLV
jgi:hypothetical protein